MRNSHLSRRIDSLKSNHESVIDDLVKEIEELEEEVDKLSDRIEELVDTIDDLKEKSNE